MKPLSPAMLDAIKSAREDNGRLYRRLKGPWDNGRLRGIRNRTIQSLVDRGLAEYTAISPGTYGRPAGMPYEVTLTERADESP